MGSVFNPCLNQCFIYCYDPAIQELLESHSTSPIFRLSSDSHFSGRFKQMDLFVFDVLSSVLYLLPALYFGSGLDLMVLKVFSDLKDSLIKNKKCSHPCSELGLWPLQLFRWNTSDQSLHNQGFHLFPASEKHSQWNPRSHFLYNSLFGTWWLHLLGVCV